jgi:hypothetical protein
VKWGLFPAAVRRGKSAKCWSPYRRRQKTRCFGNQWNRLNRGGTSNASHSRSRSLTADSPVTRASQMGHRTNRTCIKHGMWDLHSPMPILTSRLGHSHGGTMIQAQRNGSFSLRHAESTLRRGRRTKYRKGRRFKIGREPIPI